MPQVGGSAPRRPAAPRKPTPPKKPAPTYGSEAAYTGSTQQQKAGNNTTQRKIAASTATSIVDSKRAAVQKAGTGGITKRREVSVQSDSKRLASAVRTGASKTASQKANASKTGIGDTSVRRKQSINRSGGTATGGGGGGGGSRTGGGGNLGKPISEGGQNDGGRLSGAFRDSDLVGSKNDLTEFDGSSFSGGFDDVEGGGGGSGSSLAGKEAVGRVGDTQGQSLEEVVYGVNKRGRKVGRARGE